MKRRLTKLAVFLLLGAVINIAVAWGCALWAERITVESGIQPAAEILLQDRLPITAFGQTTYDSNQELGFGYFFMRATVTQYEPNSGKSRTCTIHLHQHGWPMLALTGEHRFGYYVRIDGLRTLFFAPDWGDQPPRFFAYGPMPLGFVVNSMAYTLLLCLLLLGPPALRRVIRRKRGWCINCGYDLRGEFSAGCSECGWRRGENDAQQTG